MTLEQLIREHCSSTGNMRINARLHEVNYNWNVPDLNVSGRFFYMSFKNSKPTLDEFIDYLHSRIIDFCIPQREIQNAKQKFEETGDTGLWVSLTEKARNLFIRTVNQSKTGGEPGELILFIILRYVFGAPQLACKMHLKTSSNMPVHGTDAIHVLATEDDMQLIWGEAKLYQQLSSALDQICSSIKGFVEETDTGVQRDRDIQILQDHISIPDGPLKEKVLRYFDPYETDSNQVTETFACFAGFDYTALRNINTIAGTSDFQTQFEMQYLDRITSGCDLFAEKIRTQGLHDATFVILLLPFADVAELRAKFLRKLGVSI